MAARSIGTSTLSFGLVSIPVKLYATTRKSEQISFHLMHKDCGGRLKQRYLCSRCGKEVERDQMTKGYEVAKEHYVTFDNEELQALATPASDAIAISSFVPLATIDPLFYDKPYYLGPGKGAGRAYRLMSQALAQSKRCALARYAARGKEHVVALRPIDSGLVMHQLHYTNELRDFAEVPLDSAGEANEQELQLALELIERSSASAFDPAAYQDEARLRVEQAIQEKVAGQEIAVSPSEEPKAQIIDLMQALKASLANGGHAKRGAPPAEEVVRKPAKRATKPAGSRAESARTARRAATQR